MANLLLSRWHFGINLSAVYDTSTMSTCVVLERLDRGIHHFNCSGLAELSLTST